jgi:hypothetical protein
MTLPFSIAYHNGDGEIYITMERNNLNVKELKSFIDHLDAFYRDMVPGDSLQSEGAESLGEMMMATWDDDPNPYHGDYSEE